EPISYRNNTDDWYSRYPQCLGHKQSPIAIFRHKSIDIIVPPIFFGLYDIPMAEPIILHNSGHTVQFQIPKTVLDEKPFITGGILEGTFIVEQAHFHWGSATRKGSEHMLNGHRYDLEMHIVHHNSKFADVNTARHFENGVAVIALLFKIVKINDIGYTGLDLIYKNLKSIQFHNTTIKAEEIISLGSLLGNIDRNDFYTYHGSLTTPPCSETVTWIIFANILPISYSDIKKFWNIRDTTDNQYVNIRDLQSSLFRKVYHFGHLKLQTSGWNFD
uniref:Carbonic anhydrase n=1 Tax=Glossina brevipalpis TaxID=37001 RepID=A0A1A9WYK7_9MUSC